jgi:hypothetical protein
MMMACAALFAEPTAFSIENGSWGNCSRPNAPPAGDVQSTEADWIVRLGVVVMTVNQKLYLGLGTAAVAVFLGTVIMRAAPDDPNANRKQSHDPSDPQAVGELLRYDYSHIYYDPTSDRAVYREYPGWYERNSYKVPLWFNNPNPVAVTMSFLNTSCTACSFAEIAAVPAPKVDGTAEPAPFGAVFGGTAPLGLDYAEHLERKRLIEQIPEDKWQRIVAQNGVPPAGDHKAMVDFPPGTSEKPTWGVIRLNIKVNESKTLEATIGLKKPSMPEPVPVVFKATVGLTQLCDVYPPSITFGDLPETFTSVSETVFYYSSTRTLDGPPEQQLPKPLVSGLKGDPFLTSSAPEPMTDAERAFLADHLRVVQKVPVRVSSGYKVKLTLSRTAPDPMDPSKTREIDIGPADRTVSIAPESGTVDKVPQVLVKSNTIGVVSVEGGVIDLKTFQTREGVDKKVRLYTDREGLELEAAPEKSEPQYLGVELSEPEKRNSRTYWTLRVKVAPNTGGGRLKPGDTVAVRIKGTGQLIRIPVTGNGQS